MKLQSHLPQDQVFWYLDKKLQPPLRKEIKTDALIIGGGMAGLSAAQACAQKGMKIVLLEKNFCGSGATGKSSGFITPDSELSLWHLINMYGKDEAKKLWDFIATGTHLIKKNIQDFKIDCDYQVQDTLVLANSAKAFKDDVQFEYEQRTKEGYQSILYQKDQLAPIIGSSGYEGAISYSNTFGIDAYPYCNGMKHALLDQGVQIFEDSPVIDLQNNSASTANGRVTADKVIVCIDQFAQTIPALKDNIYHAQTFLMISAPLTDQHIKALFPSERFMAWDTEDIYTYFRATGNNRILLGGATVFDTFWYHEMHNSKRIAKKLTNYWKKKFPHIPAQFEYMWPGLIGITKDLFPIAGFDQQNSSLYYIAGASGLPWAAALGALSAERVAGKSTELDSYFNPYRSFKIQGIVQKIMGKPISFALSNLLTVKGF